MRHYFSFVPLFSYAALSGPLSAPAGQCRILAFLLSYFLGPSSRLRRLLRREGPAKGPKGRQAQRDKAPKACGNRAGRAAKGLRPPFAPSAPFAGTSSEGAQRAHREKDKAPSGTEKHKNKKLNDNKDMARIAAKALRARAANENKNKCFSKKIYKLELLFRLITIPFVPGITSSKSEPLPKISESDKSSGCGLVIFNNEESRFIEVWPLEEGPAAGE